MSLDKKIIVAGNENPSSIGKVLEAMVEQQRVATVIVRRGERFLLKIVEVRKEVLIALIRALPGASTCWSPSWAASSAARSGRASPARSRRAPVRTRSS